MADNSTTNHPSVPSDYVSINDLRDRWLKQQSQQQKEEENRIEATKRNKGKEKVEEVTNNHPSLPSNYVTILDLRERWLKQQQQQQQKQEANDHVEPTRRDKGKEKVQEVIVDCQIDGNLDKNSPHCRNPNPNLIPERGFRRTTQEKPQVTEDCQVDGKEDGKNPQFRNPNPNLVRGRGFRRNSNWSDSRPVHRGFHGGEKISPQNKAVKGSCSSLEASEISDGVEIEAESVNPGGELKDAPLMSRSQKKKLKKRIRKQELEESKNIAKKGEDKELIKLNVSKIGGIQDKNREIEVKMKEINVSKIVEIKEKIRETKAEMKEITVSKSRGIGEKTWEIKARMKETNVSKIVGIKEKIWEKTRKTEVKMKEIYVSKIGEMTKKTEAKMKEMTVMEQCSPGNEKEVLMVAKTAPVWKSDREVSWGGPRAEADRRVEVYRRGARGFNYGRNEPRWANYGQVKRGDKCGVMWVKKGDGVKVNNGCVVEDGDD